MTTTTQPIAEPRPQRPAHGRYAPRKRVEDHLQPTLSVVSGTPTSAQFLEAIVRELRIRFYQPTTIKSYRSAIVCLLRWFGGPPHRITREHVREYLLFLVDAGKGSSHVANHLAAIRTCFDKLCCRNITLGLVVPRRPKRLPVVLSTEEVATLLETAISRRDKLLLGLMYATGMRVSEVVAVRLRDIDFSRRVITVWQGKGRVDRQVILPRTFEPLLKAIADNAGTEFLFEAKPGRHISPRTAQRAMKRTVEIAGIKKKATPHSLRHSYATHSFEQGADIRRIQKLLGHVRLETTTIYVKVARPTSSDDVSPLDNLQPTPQAIPERPTVGSLQIHFQPQLESSVPLAKVTLSVNQSGRPIYFTGIVVAESRPGFVTLQIPPTEDWVQPLSWLTPPQRERFNDPSFYTLLQREIARRFLHLKPVRQDDARIA